MTMSMAPNIPPLGNITPTQLVYTQLSLTKQLIVMRPQVVRLGVANGLHNLVQFVQRDYISTV